MVLAPDTLCGVLLNPKAGKTKGSFFETLELEVNTNHM